MAVAVALFDRVKEFSTTTGTGNFTLAGAQPGGFETFNANAGVGPKFFYCIQNVVASEFELGIGSLSGATTLVRETVYQSSNSDSLVSFSAGTKDVYIPAVAAFLQPMTATGDIIFCDSNGVPDNLAIGSTGHQLTVVGGLPVWAIDNVKRMTANATNATTTMANLTDLSITLVSGKKYTGRLVIKCNNDQSIEGIKLDFDGGTVSVNAVWFAASAKVTSGTVVVATNITTTLAGDLSFTTITGETVIEVEVSIDVNAGGTFIPRFAEAASTSGTVTVETGSYLHLKQSDN